MAWIRSIGKDEAQGELAAFYADLQQRRGQITPILAAQSLDATALQQHLTLYQHLLFAPGGLSRPEREIIAVVVSQANGCAYCVHEHAPRLALYLDDDAELDAALQAPERIGDARLRALALYARKLTQTPATMAAEDIAALRAQGLDDAEILQATMIAGYFNCINRIAQGLGVDAAPDDATA